MKPWCRVRDPPTTPFLTVHVTLALSIPVIYDVRVWQVRYVDAYCARGRRPNIRAIDIKFLPLLEYYSG